MDLIEYSYCFKLIKKIFPKLLNWLEALPDLRNENMIDYDLDDVVLLTILMFLFRHRSLNAFVSEFKGNTKALKNLECIFKISRWIPNDDSFRNILMTLSTKDINKLLKKIHQRLERKKIIKPLLFMDKYYLAAMDATGQISSYKIKCNECLTQTKNNKTLYMHFELALSLIDKYSRTSLCMGYESIINASGKTKYDKNDCEIQAAKRLLPEIRRMYTKRIFCITGDNLYSAQNILELIISYGWHYIITAKPDKNKELFRWYNYRNEEHKIFYYTDKNGNRHVYKWLNKIPLKYEYHEKDYYFVNLLEYTEYNNQGKKLYYSSWITDFEITTYNIKDIASGGRARFTIENRTFNEQKTRGFSLKHNFGHKGNLPSVFFGLTQIADIFSKLFSAWEIGKKVIKAVGSRWRFFEKLGCLVSETVFLLDPVPIIYLKFDWNTC